MLIYFIRHGDPDYANDSLTEKGKMQAEALAKRLAQSHIDEIFVSANGRAKMTAAPTAAATGIESKVEEWLSENIAWKNFSCEIGGGRHGFSHMQASEIMKSEDTMKRLGGDWYNAECFHGIDIAGGMKFFEEKSDEFMLRQGYERIGAIYKIVEKNEKNIAIFGHQGNGMVWLSHLLAVPLPLFGGSFDLAHTGVTIIEMRDRGSGYTAPRCVCFSDMSHIYADERLEMEYQNRLKI